MEEPAIPRHFRSAPRSVLRDAPDVRTRLGGVALIGVCGFAASRLHELVLTLPQHQPSPAEMLMSLVAVLTGISGAMMAAEGAALFRPYTLGRRAARSSSKRQA